MAGDRAQRRLAAVLAADVAGYSRLMGADEEGTLARLKAHRQLLIDPQIAGHGGRIVKTTGDGLLVEFGSVVEALRCAVAIQRGMAERNSDVAAEERIELRLGVNVGDVIVDGDDIYGDGVNVAARLEALADAGGVCVSARVREDARGKLDLAFEDGGERQLKNIAWPMRVFHLRAPGKAPHPAAATADRASIAVLPFANMSGDAEQEYFSDGITEDIITELSRYHSLLVVARNSSFQFRGTSVDIAAVRNALGVRYVIEGSVRKAGKRIRITAQLIDAITQSHLWAERYDRDIEDVFAVQDEVTRKVVATVEGRVAATGADHARRKPPEEWAAYDCFLQGRDLWHRYLGHDAIPLLARAIELDPDYVQAHALMALAQGETYVRDSQPEFLVAAEASAQRALALDEDDPSAHHAMAYVALRRNELDLAGRHFDRALALNPNDVYIACERANWLAYVGRFDEALGALRAAEERDPYPPAWIWEVRGQILFCLGRFDEAIGAFRMPQTQHFWTPALVASALAHLGRLDEARRELALFRQARPDLTATALAPKLHMPTAMRAPFLEGLRKAGLPE